MTRARHALPLLLLTLFAAGAHAAEIRIRARTQLTSTVTRTNEGLVVRGRLEDDTHRGIAERAITLSIEGWPDAATIETGPDGELVFRVTDDELSTILGAEGSRRLSLALAFSGDTRYGAAAEDRVVHVDKVDVDLSVAVVPSLVVLGDQRDARVLVETFTRGRALAGHRVSVRIADGGQRELTTGPDGRATVLLAADSLPPPGEVTITARAAETPDTNAASARSTFLVVTPTAVTLDVAQAVKDDAQRLGVRGVVTDREGPVAGAIVTIMSAGLPLSLAVTDEDGAFGARIGVDSIQSACRAASERGSGDLPDVCRAPGGQVPLQAVFTPSEPWRRASASQIAFARMPSPPRVPIAAYVITLLLALGLVLGVQAVQSGLPARLLALLRRRPERAPRRAATERAPAPEPASPPSMAATARDRIEGEVWDPLAGAAVPGARISMVGGSEERLLCVSDAEGRFETPALEDGTHRLVVNARGFLAQRVTVAIPSPARGLRIAMTALRAEALRAYRDVIEPLAGAGSWGRSTPRDLLIALEQHPDLDPERLRDLTLAFEEVYFADRELDERTPEHIRRLAEGARTLPSEAPE